jgi:hypothetical protein
MENALFHSHPFVSNSAYISLYSNNNPAAFFHLKFQFFADLPFSATPWA